jgi:hypothetical protein
MIPTEEKTRKRKRGRGVSSWNRVPASPVLALKFNTCTSTVHINQYLERLSQI